MAASAPRPRQRRLAVPILLALLHLFLAPPRCQAAAMDLLPRRLEGSLMGDTVHSAVDLLPTFVAFAAPGGPAAAWRGACFAENEATASAQSWTCMDLYVFATPYRIGWDYYTRAHQHTFEIKSWEEAGEMEYVKLHGVAIFLMPSGMLGTLLSLIDVIPLFSNTIWGQDANLAFLQKHMGASFNKRSQPWAANIRKEDVHSGDFLALSKIRGRWGGFQTLEKWVTGAFAGHTAVCLKDENGTLWVAESGYENKKGEEVIAIVPWDEWWGVALKDDSNPQVMAAMSMWTRLQPHYASNMWNEALNKRLGTERTEKLTQLDLHGIISETERRGMSFNQLLTIPEQDEWEYSDGKSTTCVAFILAMYKAAGVFAPFTESIQVTEFTIRDAYMLRIFEDNRTRLPGWCNGDADGLPFCQILGEYKMELPEYNTIQPYANMNENCPSSPPTYDRPLRC
uniref:Uncharacterized protein n=1 Tax=Aegilops tauschii TaxID=37682 RepID=M8B742_AEGTA